MMVMIIIIMIMMLIIIMMMLTIIMIMIVTLTVVINFTNMTFKKNYLDGNDGDGVARLNLSGEREFVLGLKMFSTLSNRQISQHQSISSTASITSS